MNCDEVDNPRIFCQQILGICFKRHRHIGIGGITVKKLKHVIRHWQRTGLF
jgi:hypothetical protein